MYNLLLTGLLDPSRLAAVLADEFAVAAGSVDVGSADSPGSRNWDASVSCTYEQLAGDATWSLDIYASDSCPVRPSERELAAALADGLGQAVLHPGTELLPSSYWLAAPGGLHTRARLYQSDEDDSFTIDAVGQPVSQLPRLRVARQPEAIREHPVPTPAADAFAAWLEHRFGKLAGTADSPAWQAGTFLAAWEALAARMSAGWPPDGWYPADYYREDLESRDEVEAAAVQLPADAAERLAAAVAAVDAEYRRLTADDGGAALAAAENLPPGALASSLWWWRRRPPNLPW